MRQGSTFDDGSHVELVLTGAFLEGVANLTVGEFTAHVLDATDGDVRVWLQVPHAAAPGSRDVSQ